MRHLNCKIEIGDKWPAHTNTRSSDRPTYHTSCLIISSNILLKFDLPFMCPVRPLAAWEMLN